MLQGCTKKKIEKIPHMQQGDNSNKEASICSQKGNEIIWVASLFCVYITPSKNFHKHRLQHCILRKQEQEGQTMHSEREVGEQKRSGSGTSCSLRSPLVLSIPRNFFSLPSCLLIFFKVVLNFFFSLSIMSWTQDIIS